MPGRARQGERLTPRFETLLRSFEDQRTRVQGGATGIVPEEVLVFETFGPVENFIAAVRHIPGMEWLGEIEEEGLAPDDDFFVPDKEGHPKDKPLRGRLFLIFSNQRALREMLSLWQRWLDGEQLPFGLGKWKDVFSLLRDIRPWGVQDRLIETGVLEDWQERVAYNEEVIPCEVELWYRQTQEHRTAARVRITQLVQNVQGQVLSEATVPSIHYHALLVNLPIASIALLLDPANHDVELVQCPQIQFFRAAGQMAVFTPEENAISDSLGEPTAIEGEPVAALLDGLPLQNHSRLAGKLVIEDPDDFTGLHNYTARERRHGTAMASLILHGDIGANEQPLSRPLYVRPILVPDRHPWNSASRREAVPEDQLVVDLIHRAVRRLYESESGEYPSAPSVCLINLSIGIVDRLFEGHLSPLARLLDWLAWQYKTLFIVSSGNHSSPIRLEQADLEGSDFQEAVIQFIASEGRNRRLLSPGEAINALTVGALHQDAAEDVLPRNMVDPFVDKELPGIINAQGMGYRRTIKPEILQAGGRVIMREPFVPAETPLYELYTGAMPPGQCVACPGQTEGDTTKVWYTRGTSNATALTTREAIKLYDVLDELRAAAGGELIDSIPRAIWLKALLVHGADWGSAGDLLNSILRTPDNSRKFREYVSRLLGYGAIHADRVAECSEYRVTALSGGLLLAEQSHVHRFPLPPSLSGRRGWRRLTVTLAWLTPVNPQHQAWRRAHLWFDATNDMLRVGRSQSDSNAVQRGTIQHEVFEGDRAAAFVDGESIEIQVSCRADAGALDDPVPYALAVTLEIAEEVGVPVYEEVRVRVQAARVRV